MYRVYDHQAREFIGRVYATRLAATRRADVLDLRYGAVRYLVIPCDSAGRPACVRCGQPTCNKKCGA